MANTQKSENIGNISPNDDFGARPAAPVTSRTNIANPAPLGLFALGATTFLLSMYFVGTRGVTTPNLLVGMALFYGGLAQLLAGMWAFPAGNTFAATVFVTYGAFYLSLATIYIPSSGIIAAYASPTELANALGIYLLTWMIITFFIFIASLRKAITFIAGFGFLTLTFLFLAVAEFTGNAKIQKAGGAFGIIASLGVLYVGLSELLGSESKRVFSLPIFPL